MQRILGVKQIIIFQMPSLWIAHIPIYAFFRKFYLKY